MEKNLKNADDVSTNLNANSAYSGSGTMQPGGGTGEAGKLSDYPAGNLDEVTMQNDTLAGNPPDQSSSPSEGRTMEEATDPDKLSNI